MVLLGAMLPLKVPLFLGCQCTDPDVRAVISCPISGPAGAGPGDCCSGPEGTLPPAGEFRTGVVCLSGPHLPPPGKVTSQSSSSGSLLPNGHAQSLGGGLLGVQLIHTAQSPVRDP